MPEFLMKILIRLMVGFYVVCFIYIIMIAFAGIGVTAENTNIPYNLPYDKYVYGFPLTSGYYAVRKGARHNAWDLALPTGTPLRATMSGTVSIKGDDIAGTYITITNGKWLVGYAHLSEIDLKHIVLGTIKQGEILSYSGDTGRSTGPHLHYWITYNGKRINPQRTMHYKKQ